MKKLITVCICTGLAISLGGCSLRNLIDQFTSTGDTSVRETPSSDTQNTSKGRIYMDELTGILQDFSGSQLVLSVNNTQYAFNVSNATLECEDGMITGDEISIIYQGQLSDNDTSTVNVLKVVDEYHKKARLKARIAYGQVLSLTPNTVTIRSQKGKTATYPITGTEQYYGSGIKADDWIYLHFKGKFPKSTDGDPDSLNASHLKVLSISNMKSIQIPEPSPTPVPSPGVEEIPQEMPGKEQQFSATIQNVNLNILQVIQDGGSAVLNIDMSDIPVYFKGGIAPGSHVNITYTGKMNPDSLDGIQILAVTGEDPDEISDKHISFTASGTIQGKTANTVTIQTTDGAIDTFRTDNVQDLSTGGLEYGCSVRITFHPSASKTSNIYTAIKIQDA